ncbi:MAG: aminoacyl-tRNA hydrolase [Campylobacteraceae bacterium 4484_4]|nr:MAG: aminoacyl-tRNA hydrolase [Campylobacteraceae bacterium 4484_4]
MVLIVGLGNPDEKYLRNRHNVGFMVLDKLIGDLKPTPVSKSSFRGELYKYRNILLLKPMTYMNLSGESVQAVAHYYKPERIIVIHDELDIDLGRIKLKHDGGHGGHNGLKSIDAHIGSDYDRIRIGISKPSDKSKVISYVLSDFSKEEQECLEKVIDKAAELALELSEKGFKEVQSRFSSRQNLCS